MIHADLQNKTLNKVNMGKIVGKTVY